jgi:hypothetical protein
VRDILRVDALHPTLHRRQRFAGNPRGHERSLCGGREGAGWGSYPASAAEAVPARHGGTRGNHIWLIQESGNTRIKAMLEGDAFVRQQRNPPAIFPFRLHQSRYCRLTAAFVACAQAPDPSQIRAAELSQIS